jgi:hypothetical protein
MMTRKDYTSTAEILSSYKDLIGDEFTYHDLVEDFAGMFAQDNPNFDPDRFLEACNK